MYVLLAVCLVNLPWQMRNYAVFGEAFLVKSNFSREFFMGNYGNRALMEEEKEYMKTLDEGERSKIYATKALASISSDPWRLIKRTLKRFILYWMGTTKKDMFSKQELGISEKIVGAS